MLISNGVSQNLTLRKVTKALKTVRQCPGWEELQKVKLFNTARHTNMSSLSDPPVVTLHYLSVDCAICLWLLKLTQRWRRALWSENIIQVDSKMFIPLAAMEDLKQ